MNSNTNQPDAFNSSTSSRTASVNPSSSVRPRNRRLISLAGNDDDISGTTPIDQVTGSSSDNILSSNSLLTPPAPRSRAGTPSPTQSRYSSRPPTGSQDRDRPSREARVGNGWPDTRQNKPTSPFVADFLESSWSSLQGLASTVLGNQDILGNVKPPTSKSSGRQHRRKPSKANFIQDARSGPSSWGPANLFIKHLGSGPKEDRQATIQALRRQALLQANGDLTQDTQGNYKRRDSGDTPRGSSAPPPEQDDSDALVYVHHVQKNDSVTGVSIKYGCQPTVMRKANGFWPSDSVQARKTVLLPVEACTLKGCRLPEKEDNVHIFEDLSISTEDPFIDHTSLVPDSAASSSFGYGKHSLRSQYAGSATSSISGKTPKQAPPWKHECWVQIDGFPEPVEIGRVPRKTLGFFPRARRKSIGQSLTPYSDSEDTPLPLSQEQTHDTNTTSIPSSSVTPSPFVAASSSSHSRNRSTSSSKLLPNPGIRRHRNSFTLSGPGGVGTLGGNVNAPGPAEDKLNQFIKTHLPQLAVPPPPPPYQFPSSSSASYYPRASSESTSTIISNTSSTGLENVSGAIEGWVRKMARSAKAGVTDLQQQQQQQPGGHLGITGTGDLIELADTPDGKGSPSRAGDNGGMTSSTRNARGHDVNRSPTRISSGLGSGTGSGPTIGALGSGNGGGGNGSLRGRRKKSD
ncbi:hypothetical protein AJ78_05363 [Emergomyces pasteurianus Ep9510]|uniref:LysM domain-containing protein n=1 Tax=Emergomyces pasteurianus Ep9510 TaxID=1447872 RepID=A0A1J9QGH3_9EURO|nr:hypothetical protein AJ78_05363 [Emergomyces pasteurianus Ep9510]